MTDHCLNRSVGCITWLENGRWPTIVLYTAVANSPLTVSVFIKQPQTIVRGEYPCREVDKCDYFKYSNTS